MSVKIEIHIKAGLGNRIRVINSLLNYLVSRGVSDYSVKVIWLIEPDFNINFEEIFEKIDKVSIVTIKKNSPEFLWYKLRYALIFKVLGPKINAFENIRNSDTLPSGPGSVKNIYISTVHLFHPILKNLVFFNKATLASAKIPEKKYIGIHIRQGDNAQSILNSPVGLFEDKIREILAENPSTLFYLSTDSLELRSKFSELFKGSLVTSDFQRIGRDTPEGIRDAAREIIILSKSDRIIGSFYSSFSEAAATFHQIPLQILKK